MCLKGCVNMKKPILIIIASVLVAAAAVSGGFFAHDYSSAREVRSAFNSELELLLKENEELDKKKDELKNSVSETERSIDSKNEMGAEAAEYESQLETLRQKLDSANKTLTELETSIEKKKEYIDQADSIKKVTKGRSFTASDKKLECPDSISAGRYIAEGRGNLLVYNSSNTLRISENLSTIDTNSFTFDISEGEAVKVTESVTFTSLR